MAPHSLHLKRLPASAAETFQLFPQEQPARIVPDEGPAFFAVGGTEFALFAARRIALHACFAAICTVLSLIHI